MATGDVSKRTIQLAQVSGGAAIGARMFSDVVTIRNELLIPEKKESNGILLRILAKNRITKLKKMILFKL